MVQDQPVGQGDRHAVGDHAPVQLGVLGAGQPGREPAGVPQVAGADQAGPAQAGLVAQAAPLQGPAAGPEPRPDRLLGMATPTAWVVSPARTARSTTSGPQLHVGVDIADPLAGGVGDAQVALGAPFRPAPQGQVGVALGHRPGGVRGAVVDHDQLEGRPGLGPDRAQAGLDRAPGVAGRHHHRHQRRHRRSSRAAGSGAGRAGAPPRPPRRRSRPRRRPSRNGPRGGRRRRAGPGRRRPGSGRPGCPPTTPGPMASAAGRPRASTTSGTSPSSSTAITSRSLGVGRLTRS